ncbi:SDR family NAD(P)-dependent oxidoreductase [Nonomuraea sp. NPDC050643]|uniref:SDR family NAD(P)-dependent oxidoreductase n=1 Tax=Nonomuraea sp. NPDC050643 TaxID=3155660 RepID=UPI0033DE1AE1
MSPARFTGQVALVTGAATGIGAATARALAREGAVVAINHWRRPEQAEALAAELSGTGAFAVEADVSAAAAVGEMVEHVEKTAGPIDLLVNNAAILSRADSAELAEDEWDRVLAVNLTGVFLCCKYVARSMIPRRSGRIVNISSDLAFTGEARLAHYCAAKAGVLGLSKALARELIPYGVRVNVVAPGMTETPMLMANPVAYNPGRQAAIPAGRWARPAEIAASICFLASPEADYYVGAVLCPNGGLVI